MRCEAIRLAWKTARLTSAVSLLANLAAAVLLAVFIVSSGTLLGNIPRAVGVGWDSGPGRAVASSLVGTGLCFLGVQILNPVKSSLGALVTRQVDGAVRDRLAIASVSAPGLAPLENQDLLKQLAIAKWGLEEGNRTPGAAVAGLLTLSGMYAQSFLAAALLVLQISPVVGLSLLGGALAIRRSHRIGLAREAKINALKRARLAKESGYYRDLGLGVAASKEIRTFGLERWVGGRFRDISVRALETTVEERREIHGNRFIPPVLAAMTVSLLSLMWIAGEAVSGEISIAYLVIALQAGYVTLSIGNYFVEDWETQYGLVAHSAVESFRAGMGSLDKADVPVPRQEARQLHTIPQQSIQFRGISFHYPGSRELVLNNLDLDVPVGRSLAIVGLNGAGKTTLIKLLTGLYEPSAGAILVDGVDLRTLEPGQWRRNVAVIFQDFVHYQTSAAENIAFGDAAVGERRDAIRRAAERAGVLELLEDLPKGLDTPLSSNYRDGVDLSGGQWQRLALARAFYAVEAGANILVLDEPTASLDIRSEAAFLDRFIELTKGLTTVVISHRFATVRKADWIVALETGKIVEQGTHESLLATGRRYREMFDLQAERFALSARVNQQRTGEAE
jgi:ATP-binding cassette subfamily B protein